MKTLSLPPQGQVGGSRAPVLHPSTWGLREEHLAPGEVLLTNEPCCVTTILGSCVAICLHHEDTGRAAICHSLLPIAMRQDPEGLGSLKFVTSALDYMIDYFCSCAERPQCLRAKLFGGAKVLQMSETAPGFQVGVRNIEAAENWLRKREIQVVARDVGGTFGRKLHFNTKTGDVLLRRVGRSED